MNFWLHRFVDLRGDEAMAAAECGQQVGALWPASRRIIGGCSAQRRLLTVSIWQQAERIVQREIRVRDLAVR